MTCSKSTKMIKSKIIKSKMSYSDSEPDSNFVMNLVSNFAPFFLNLNLNLILKLNLILVQCL